MAGNGSLIVQNYSAALISSYTTCVRDVHVVRLVAEPTHVFAV